MSSISFMWVLVRTADSCPHCRPSKSQSWGLELISLSLSAESYACWDLRIATTWSHRYLVDNIDEYCWLTGYKKWGRRRSQEWISYFWLLIYFWMALTDSLPLKGKKLFADMHICLQVGRILKMVHNSNLMLLYLLVSFIFCLSWPTNNMIISYLYTVFQRNLHNLKHWGNRRSKAPCRPRTYNLERDYKHVNSKL